MKELLTKPLLSIIIPVYNLQEYIVQALDSIFLQNVDTSLFEVIIVDDGSKDNSLDLIKEYASSYDNIIVKSQNNGGVSKARNVALNLATGLYVTFLDADDRFAENSLTRLFEIILQSVESDVIYCRSYVLYPSGIKESHLWQRHFTTKKIYNGKDIIKLQYLNGGSVCGGLYRTEYIHSQQLAFAEGVANAEDTIFNYILYSRNPKISFADIPLNLVTVREGSASRSDSIERVVKYRNNMSYLLAYRENRILSNEEREIVDMATYHSIVCAIGMYIRSGGKDSNYIAHLLNLKEILPLRIKHLNLNQLVKIFILNYCYSLYFLLMKIQKTFVYYIK